MQKYITLSLAAGLAALSLSSYSSGPYGTASINQTGAAGTTAGCSGGGCHAGNNAATMVSIAVSQGGSPVTSYIPGNTYVVTINGANNTTNLPKFGFQSAIAKVSNTSQQAGTLTANAAGTALRTTPSGLQIVEHSNKLSGTGSALSWTYAVSYNWTAPAAGTGAVRIYATLNAVNNNGSQSLDQPNANFMDLPEVTSTAVANVNNGVPAFEYFPNPVCETLYLRGTALEQSEVRIIGLTGNVVWQSAPQQGSELKVPTGNWSSGLYLIYLNGRPAGKLLK